MPDKDLQALVRRRLWELRRTAEEAARRTHWVLATDTVERMAHERGRTFISDGLVPFVARALDVPESRVRRAAGLPPVFDPREDITTRPHLRLVKDGEEEPGPPRPRTPSPESTPSGVHPPD
ncbi:MAG: hypothetical protein M3Q47_14925 [Actinomycetota bacterium]|nr:hypothetical protein [Actinomycetota bacterium]